MPTAPEKSVHWGTLEVTGGPRELRDWFGVTPHVVRQRLRLGAVSPKLMQIYRDGDLALDQLMAFAITEDHAGQEAAFERLSF